MSANKRSSPFIPLISENFEDHLSNFIRKAVSGFIVRVSLLTVQHAFPKLLSPRLPSPCRRRGASLRRSQLLLLHAQRPASLQFDLLAFSIPRCSDQSAWRIRGARSRLVTDPLQGCQKRSIPDGGSRILRCLLPAGRSESRRHVSNHRPHRYWAVAVLRIGRTPWPLHQPAASRLGSRLEPL